MWMEWATPSRPIPEILHVLPRVSVSSFLRCEIPRLEQKAKSRGSRQHLHLRKVKLQHRVVAAVQIARLCVPVFSAVSPLSALLSCRLIDQMPEVTMLIL